MTKKRLIWIYAAAGTAGGITPFIVPEDWFGYVLATCLIGMLVFAALARGSVEPKEPEASGLLLSFLIGTDRPLAKLNDPVALALFFLFVTYLAGFTVGAFAAVRA